MMTYIDDKYTLFATQYRKTTLGMYIQYNNNADLSAVATHKKRQVM